MRHPLVLLVLALVAAPACKSDPKPSPSPAASASVAKASSTLPDLDSLLKLDGDAGEPAGGDANEPAGESANLKLLAPGAAPQTPARYEFALEKPQKTTATVRMSAEGAMAANVGAQPPLRLTMELTPRFRAPAGDVKFTLEVTKAEVVTGGAKLPPEAARELKAMEGAIEGFKGSFDVSPRGSVSNLQLGGAGMPPELQELFIPLVELFFIPMPEEPIGVGARWSITSGSAEGESMTSTMTMTARTGTTAEVTVDTERTATPREVPDPRAPRGATMKLDGKGKTRMTVRLDGITLKADGESKTVVTLSDPTVTPPRVETNTIVVKQTLQEAK